MKKIIKKLGGSYLVTFDAQEREIYGLDEGSHVQIELINISQNSLNFTPEAKE